ncbi:MAG: hypothetical protein WCY38_02000 [Endomicrobiia bacterium]
MKKINIILSFMFICLFVMLFANYSFANNLTDKHVYSLCTENFNGATQEARTIDDNIVFYTWGVKDSTPTAPYVPNLTAKEGNQCYQECTVIGSTDTGSYSGFCYTFATGIANTTTRRDISAFSTLEFYIRPKTGDVSSIRVGVTDAADRTVTLSSLGVNNSSHTWQKCSLNLTTLPSVNLTNIKNVMLFITTKQTATFDLDSIVLKRATPGSFDATVKNISDNIANTTITWNQSSFGSGWVASEQYIELNLDILESDAWSVKIYTVGGSSVTTNGLFATTDSSKVLPVCWRVNDVILPAEVIEGTRTIKKSMTIAESAYKGEDGDKCYLYDGEDQTSDPGIAGFWCWFHLTDVLDTTAGDYAVVWDKRGFHGAENAGSFYGMSGEIYPRIYLGANFTSALYGLTYRANIAIELSYE